LDNAKTIEVDVDLSFADFYKANLGMSLYSLRHLIGLILIATILWIVCFAASFLSYPWSENADALAQWLFPAIVAAILTFLILVPSVPFFRAKQMLRSGGDDGKRHYAFSETGINVESRLGSANVKWASFRKVRETRRDFLLYALPGFANIVPKRCFPTETSVADFRSLVRRQVQKFKLRD